MRQAGMAILAVCFKRLKGEDARGTNQIEPSFGSRKLAESSLFSLSPAFAALADSSPGLHGRNEWLTAIQNLQLAVDSICRGASRLRGFIMAYLALLREGSR